MEQSMRSRFLLPFLLTALMASPLAAQEPTSDLERLELTAQTNRRDAGAQRAYGMALLRAGQYRQAEQVLRGAARLAGTPEAQFDVARVAFAQGDYRAARSACRPLERGSSVLKHVCRARAFLAWHRSSRAFAELERAAGIDGRNFEASLALGDAHRLQGDVSEAEAAYRQALAIEGGRYEPHLGLGLLYSSARRDDDALSALRAAHQRAPQEPVVSYELARRLPAAEARPLLEGALAQRSGYAEARLALADAQLQLGQHAEAIAAYRAFLAEDDSSPAAHAGLGQALVASGQADEGRMELERSLEMVPNQPAVVLALGHLAESQGQHQRAFEHYRHANDLNPRDPEAMLQAARLALEVDRDVLATGYLDRILRTHRHHGQALVLYGDALARRGDRAGARTHYQRALDQGTGDFDRAAAQAGVAANSGEAERRVLHRAVR